jgi:hypothetical protein
LPKEFHEQNGFRPGDGLSVNPKRGLTLCGEAGKPRKSNRLPRVSPLFGLALRRRKEINYRILSLSMEVFGNSIRHENHRV